MSLHGICKAVIPAAGLGTRFLPATRVVPKELLPICAKPLIQFAVEEAIASGIETVILVISRGKELVAEYFRPNASLENALAQRGKGEEAALIRRLSELAAIHIVYQDTPLGLADAIGRARSFVADEPFAVILPDALIDSDVPCIRQLIDCYEKHGGCVVATREVGSSEIERFGIVDAVAMSDPCCGGRTLQAVSLTERPKGGSLQARYGIFGRYILQPAIFACIEQTRPGFGGELQLTDSLSLLSGTEPIFAYLFAGNHYDAGSKIGFLRATLAYALKDPELALAVREQTPNFESLMIASTRP